MRTRKIIIYPLILASLFSLTASASEVVGTEAVDSEVQEENNGNEEPENVGGNEPETGNVSESDLEIPAETESEPAAETPPETIPEGEVNTAPAEETMVESTSAEIESETEPQTETETEKPILGEEVTGLLKEYLTGAVSGNDAPEETSAEPINTEYQDYVKEALRILQDNSTSQVSLSIVILVALGILAGCFVAFMVMRRFL